MPNYANMAYLRHGYGQTWNMPVRLTLDKLKFHSQSFSSSKLKVRSGPAIVLSYPLLTSTNPSFQVWPSEFISKNRLEIWIFISGSIVSGLLQWRIVNSPSAEYAIPWDSKHDCKIFPRTRMVLKKQTLNSVKFKPFEIKYKSIQWTRNLRTTSSRLIWPI